ncbi:DUF3429 domain-containing protein [Rhizosaccharibacter radicis]|uniref:DUF3429 domain-containing protein n=1 Tax=Rhizosaccharibacter radicis TaxID=2782605 RepID=A0ABT1VX18_9PROT|nr:DUF3429 domain-containing protein [Acetobacteraceae bacterium KSS12]
MKHLPLFAILLGLGGLLPFLFCVVAIVAFPSSVPVPRLVMALCFYGACILSFLGGVHWGFALSPDGGGAVPGRRNADRWRLCLGVLPSLVGWAALLVTLVSSPVLALAILAIGFLLTIAAEVAAQRRGLMPPGYLALRWLLTAVVVLCLLAAAGARLVG